VRRPEYPARVQLYLVRHADAAPGEPDELRSLTEEGREQARRLGERLLEEGVQPDTVLTSPLLRARETADLLCESHDIRPQTDERLAPGASAAVVRELVAGRGDRVVVIAHQPDCGRIAAELSGGAEPAFPPAGMVRVEL
jgi:phosphohistidine phosphatase